MDLELERKAMRIYVYIDAQEGDAEIQELRDSLLLYAAYLNNKRRPPSKLMSYIMGDITGLCINLRIDISGDDLPGIVTTVTQNVVLNATDEDLDNAEKLLPVD